MGQPKGMTVLEAQERTRQRDIVQETAACICADAIERALKNPMALRREYGISAVEWPDVLAAIQAVQRKIDPYGDWK